MGVLIHQGKSLLLILVNKTQNLSWVCIIMLVIVIFFVNGKGIFKFKADNENVNFITQFCLGSISNGFRTNSLV